jgi:hypothetical protein
MLFPNAWTERILVRLLAGFPDGLEGKTYRVCSNVDVFLFTVGDQVVLPQEGMAFDLQSCGDYTSGLDDAFKLTRHQCQS